MKWLRSQRGDTIAEVLICIAVLSFILSISYGLANRSSLAVRQSQERSEAQKISEAQIESLKAYLSDPNHTVPATSADGTSNAFCLKNGAIVSVPDVNNLPADCSAGTQDTPGVGRYKTYIVLYNGSYTSKTSWPKVTGGSDQVTFAYKVYLASATSTDLTGGTSGSVATCPASQWLNSAGLCKYICDNGDDDDGDGRIDLLDPGCGGNSQRTSETGPAVAGSISGNGDFGSWHLANNGGTRNTRTFTITNTSNDAPLNLTTATLSGANTNVFSITSNGCANRSLARAGQPNSTCNITVQFYPPSGGTNNRLGNAGLKNATLTVSNSSGVAATTTALVGRAFSDQAGPGDIITGSTQYYLHTYNPACYNNVEACGSAFTGVAGNGNLILGNTYCLWGGWGPGGYGNYSGDANKLIMQSDGNLVFYDPFTYRYASWTQGVPNLWLRIQDPGAGVYLHQNNPGVAYKWIHANGSCFAW